jgi:rhodanese-related sulfurtransferase
MSAQATEDLVAAGYTNVVDLDGGMNAWVANGGERLEDSSVTDG